MGTAALLIVLGACKSPPPPAPVEAAGPRLVVLVVVDQLRGDELDVYAPLWQRGMARLLGKGRVFDQAFYQHARTETAAGHATLATGVQPRLHGVLDKRLFDPALGKTVRICKLIPGPCSPTALLVPTLGDRLKAVEPDALVASVSLKDRSAVLLGGRHADVVAWIEDEPRQLAGTTLDAPSPPGFLREPFEAWTAPGRWPAAWILPDVSRLPEPFRSRPDAASGEIDRGDGIVFPHSLRQRPTTDLLPESVAAWPLADEVVVDLALTTARQLRMGQDDIADLLFVSLSANDLRGHSFGPDSLERAAGMVALDDALGRLVDGLEALAPGRLLVGLSSDHGVAPTPQVARAQGNEAGRPRRADLEAFVEAGLDRELGPQDYVAELWPPYLSLRPSLDADLRTRAAKEGARILAEHPAVHMAWPTGELSSSSDPIARLLFENSPPGRAGEISFAFRPYFQLYHPSEGDDGSEHGTPWEYDRHVPVVLFGQGVSPGRDKRQVQPIDLTATLAKRLGLATWEGAGTVLEP